MRYYGNFLGGLRLQWISYKMKVWHPLLLKKSKSWGPFWTYQLKSTANSAHLAQFLGKLAKLAVKWATLFRANPVIILLKVRSLTLNNLIFNILKLTQMCSRWVSVVEFHDPTLSIGKVFGQESTVVKWNYQILSLHLVTVCQKVPILNFQSEFSMWKIIRIFLKKNHWKISIQAHLFCKKHLLLTSISKPLY